jgi:hypothetical protein
MAQIAQLAPGLSGLYAYRRASPYCNYTSPYYAPYLCYGYSW